MSTFLGGSESFAVIGVLVYGRNTINLRFRDADAGRTGQKSCCTSRRCSLCVCVIGEVSVMKGNICPQLVVKTKYTDTLIKLSLYLLTY